MGWHRVASLVTDDPYDRIEGWIEFARGCPALAGSNPYQDVPISPTSVFLFTSTTSPLPYATRTGSWFAYPNLRALLNHLRFVILVHHWGLWLCRDEWDPRFSDLHLSPVPLVHLFAGARAAGVPQACDIAPMERVVSLLEPQTWPALEKAARAFNRKWKSTPTWDFSLKPFDSPIALGRHVWTHDACASVSASTRKAWLDLCARATADPAASAELLTVLQEACAL